MLYDLKGWTPPAVLQESFASGKGVGEAMTVAQQSITQHFIKMGVPAGQAEEASKVFAHQLAEGIGHGLPPSKAITFARESTKVETGGPAAAGSHHEPVNAIGQALARGEGIKEALAQAGVKGPVTKAQVEVFVRALQEAVAKGHDMATALKEAETTMKAVETAKAAQAGTGPTTLMGSLAAGGDEAKAALKAATNGMPADQAGAFMKAFQAASVAGADAGTALKTAQAGASKQADIAQQQSVPLSDAAKMIAGLASGDDAVARQLASQPGGAALLQALSKGAGAEQAAQAARQAEQAEQAVAHDQAVPMSPQAQMMAALANATGGAAQALSKAGDTFAQALVSALGSGANANAAVSAANNATTAAASQSSQSTAPMSPAAQLASALASGENAGAAIQSAAAASGGDAQAFTNSLSNALAGGANPAAASQTANNAAVSASQQNSASSEGVSGDKTVMALATGDTGSPTIASYAAANNISISTPTPSSPGAPAGTPASTTGSSPTTTPSTPSTPAAAPPSSPPSSGTQVASTGNPGTGTPPPTAPGTDKGTGTGSTQGPGSPQGTPSTPDQPSTPPPAPPITFDPPPPPPVAPPPPPPNTMDPHPDTTIINPPPKVLPVYDPIGITVDSTQITYTEKNPALTIDHLLTIRDDSHFTFSGATVKITNVVSGEDILSINPALGANAVYDAASGTLTVTGGNLQLALQSVAYRDTSLNPDTTLRHLQFTISDSRGYNASGNRDVGVISVNDAPTFAGTAGGTYTERATPLHVVTSPVINDVDAPTWNGGSVTAKLASYQVGDVLGVDTSGAVTLGAARAVLYNGTQVGTINQANDGNAHDLEIHLNANCTLSMVQDLVGSLTYSTTSHDPTIHDTVTSRAVTVTIDDGNNTDSFVKAGLTASQSGTINILAVDDPPTFTGTVNATAYTELGAAHALITTPAFSDVDAIAFNGGKVTAHLAAYQPADLLSIVNGNLITSAGGNVSYNGTVIGTVSGGSVSDLVVSLNANSTATAVQALIGQLYFSNTGQDPGVHGTQLSRDVTVTVDDGNNTGTAAGSVAATAMQGSFSISEVNNAPTLSAPSTLTVAENGSATVTGITIGDVDAASLTVTVSAGTHETLSLGTTGGLTFTTNTATQMVFSGTAADVQAALLSLGYAPETHYCSSIGTSSDTISLSVTDNGSSGTGGALSASASIAVTVSHVNTAPTLTTSGTYSLGTESTGDANPGGTLVSRLLSGNVSDQLSHTQGADIVDGSGIAIVGQSVPYGVWQYSTDNQASWHSFGAVGTANALLLDQNDYVRFVGDGTHITTPTLSYCAWDETTGGHGTYVSAAATGGTTAFSTATGTADITLFSASGPKIEANGVGALPFSLAAGHGLIDTSGWSVTTFPASDDTSWVENITSAFPAGLKFNNTTYSGSQFFVGSNGYVTFGSGMNSCSTSSLTGATSPMISALSNDIYTAWSWLGLFGSGGTISAAVNDVSHEVVVTYDNVVRFGTDNGLFAGAPPRDSFQIHLISLAGQPGYSSTDFGIELRYANLDWGGGSQSGWSFGSPGSGDYLNIGASTTASDVGHAGVEAWVVRNGQVYTAAPTVAESVGAGTVVANLSMQRAVSGETYTYSLASNPGGTFTIVGNQLLVAATGDVGYQETGTGYYTVNVNASGNMGSTSTIAVEVDVTTVSHVLSLAGTTGGAFTENGSLTLGGGLTLTDTHIHDFTGTTVTVSGTAWQAGDVVTVAAGGAVTKVGSTVYYNGVDVASLSGGTNGDLTVTFENGAGLFAARAVLADLTFTSGHDPTVQGADPTRDVTVTVNDGSQTASQSGTISITAINDPPVITPATSKTVAENGTLINITGTSVADPDIGAHAMTMTLSDGHGVIGLAQTTGLTFSSGGNNSAAMTFSGTITDVNSAIASLSYTPTTYYNGSDTITLVANDGGFVGTGGVGTDTKTIGITVTSVNDPPRLASAVNLTGNGDYVSLPTISTGGGFTFEAWVKVTAYTNWARFLDLGTAANGAGRNLLVGEDGSTGKLFFQTFDSGLSTSQLVAPTSLPTGQWVEVAATVDANGNACLYQNGILVASGVQAAPATANYTLNYIGKSNWAVDPYLDGEVRDVRLWSTVRTASEILANEQVLSDPTNPALLAHYDFSGGGGSTTAADLSGHGNTATLINGASYISDSNFTTALSSVITGETHSAGNTVASILTSGIITEVPYDNSPVSAIAVWATDTSHGTWQYELAGTATWTAIGTVTPSAALLLDSSDRIRFVPTSGYTGTATFTYTAWDKTDNAVDGSYANIVGNGTGTSAYSAASENASITVLPGLPSGFATLTDFSSQPSGWTLSGNAQITTSAGMPSSHLQLTSAANNQLGAAFDDTAFSTKYGVHVSFDYYDGSGNGADGFSMFLYDGSSTSHAVGPVGGALGYATSAGSNGLPMAYLGIGFDEFGNWLNSSSVPNGAAIGLQPEHIGLRGHGDGTTGYDYISGSSVDVSRYGGVDHGTREVDLTITADQHLTMKMSWDGGNTWQYIYNNFDFGSVDGGSLPDTLKLGFAASNGGANNEHSIDNLHIGIPTDLAATFSSWPGVAYNNSSTSYSFTVTNNGTVGDPSAHVTSAVPTGLSGMTWTASTLGGVSWSGSGAIDDHVDLSPGDIATYNVTGTVSSSASSFTPSVTVATSAELYDTNSSNNTSSITESINHAPTYGNENALHLDGSNGAVNVGNASALSPTGQLTIEAWFKVTATGFEDIVDKMIEGGGTFDGYKLIVSGQHLVFDIAGGGSSWSEVDGTTNVADGSWHHVAATYDGTNMRLYVDGQNEVLTGSSVAGTGLDVSSQNLTIGGDPYSAGHTFNGDIADVKLWNTARAQSSIVQDMSLKGGTDITKVGEWMLDEGSGSSAYDSSGRGNNGSISGAAWTSLDNLSITDGSTYKGLLLATDPDTANGDQVHSTIIANTANASVQPYPTQAWWLTNTPGTFTIANHDSGAANESFTMQATDQYGQTATHTVNVSVHT